MQEYVQEKSVAIVMTGTRLTGRLMFKAVKGLLSIPGRRKRTLHHGKQSLKQLQKHGKGISTADVAYDGGMRLFRKTMRKYHINYTLQRDKTVTGPKKKWILYFHGDSPDVVNQALKDFTAQMLARGKTQKSANARPSIRRMLEHFKSVVKSMSKDRVRKQERSR